MRITCRPIDDPIETTIRIETTKLSAEVATRGYVSGIKGGSFLDRETGARDLGFGLVIADFLLEPALKGDPVVPGQYEYGPALPVHGDIPKRYAEGPQICTQVQRLPARILNGEDFTAIVSRFRWTKAYQPHEKCGSCWEQTLVFPHRERYFLAADRVTTVLESSELFLRLDMPGHIKHKAGREFEHVYLSYNEPAYVPSSEFLGDFPPDARFLYRRDDGKLPERFIRAYQVRLPGGQVGPWLAGMTLDPGSVYQAWCHQRSYVCMIQEIHGRPTKPGDTFGACYAVGWFADVAEMEAVYGRHRGWSGLEFEGRNDQPASYRGVGAGELKPVVIE